MTPSTPLGAGRWKRVVLALVLYLAIEASYPPDAQLTARMGVVAIRGYQATLSKLFGSMGGHCRFTPTCSQYGVACFEKYGTMRGGVKTAVRLWNCSPWGPPPGQDPP